MAVNFIDHFLMTQREGPYFYQKNLFPHYMKGLLNNPVGYGFS